MLKIQDKFDTIFVLWLGNIIILLIILVFCWFASDNKKNPQPETTIDYSLEEYTNDAKYIKITIDIVKETEVTE